MAFIIRWLHVASASFLFGGAALIFLLLSLKHGRPGPERRVLADLLQAYELASWVFAGLIVATGIGNLGHFGETLPGPHSEWGRELTGKLALVIAFLLFSAVRTLAVASFSSLPADAEVPQRLQRNIAGLYGGSALFVVAIVGMAIALAHF